MTEVIAASHSHHLPHSKRAQQDQQDESMEKIPSCHNIGQAQNPSEPTLKSPQNPLKSRQAT
jgi:hypothetical protein